MARSLIVNLTGFPVSLPFPYKGYLQGGEAATVEGAKATVEARLGGSDLIRYVLEVRDTLDSASVTSHDAAPGVNSKKITNIADATADADVPSKLQMDTAIAVAVGALDMKDAAKVGTTTTLTLHDGGSVPTYTTQTITGGANNAFPTVDGVAPVLGMRVLVKNEAATARNGWYTLTTLGTGATPWVLTRAADANTAGEMTVDAYSFIAQGTLQAGQAYRVSTAPTTLGTDPIVFAKIDDGTSSVVSLTTRVSTEESTRTSVDTSLTTRVSAAESVETSTTGSLETRVSTEESTRTSADTSLETRVSTEESTRASADTSLETRVSTAESVETSTTGSLETRVSTEESTRASADTSLTTRISTEESTRASADASIVGGPLVQLRTATIVHGDLTNAVNGVAEVENIGAVLPANAHILGVSAKLGTQFSGGGIVSLDVKVGTAGDDIGLASGISGMDAAIDGEVDNIVPGTAPHKHFVAAGAQIIATFTPDGAHNLNDMTTGEITVNVLFTVI